MTATIVSLIGIAITLVIHTGAFFYWGGQVRQLLREHDRRIGDHDMRIIQLERRRGSVQYPEV